MSRLRARSFLLRGIATAGACLYAISAQAQVCNVQPAFPDGTVTNVMDRDRMLCIQGLSFPIMPPRISDPNRPVNAWPRDPANSEGNWTDSRGHTIVRGSFGLWHTYDSDQGLAGGALSGYGDYGPYSTPRYTDIDLLRIDYFNPGARVTSPEDWWLVRRPEIFSMIQRDLYGRAIDPNLAAVNWVVSAETTGTQVVGAASYPYRQKTFTGTVDISGYPALRNTPVIVAQCRYPAEVGKRYPVVVTYGEGTARFQYTAPQGFGVCSFNPGQVQPDNGNNGALSSYVIGLLNKGDWRDPGDPGTLVAWGWAIGRLIDRFATDPDIDEDRVAVQGHSRYGKATLVTAAYDDRVVVAWPSSAGALGTVMARRHYGEELEFVGTSSSEYHWVAGGILQYAGELNPGTHIPRKLELLKVDAHSTVSMIAPRAIFATAGTDTPPGNGDGWNDPRGTWLSGHLASPVWNLLGWKGQIIPDGTVFTSGIDESIGGTPPFNTAFIEGTIGWRRHIEGHTSVPDWPTFAIFAARYLHDNRPVIAAEQAFPIDGGNNVAIARIAASDPDPEDSVGSFQIKGGDGVKLFQLSANGTIGLDKYQRIDWANATEYSLVVFAGDGKRPSFDATVKITIPDQVKMCKKTRSTVDTPKGKQLVTTYQNLTVPKAGVKANIDQGMSLGVCPAN